MRNVSYLEEIIQLNVLQSVRNFKIKNMHEILAIITFKTPLFHMIFFSQNYNKYTFKKSFLYAI